RCTEMCGTSYILTGTWQQRESPGNKLRYFKLDFARRRLLLLGNRFKPCLALVLALLPVALFAAQQGGGTLTGSFSSITPGSSINLTAIGKLDWIHWGLS